jgi:hypothetical protein
MGRRAFTAYHRRFARGIQLDRWNTLLRDLCAARG